MMLMEFNRSQVNQFRKSFQFFISVPRNILIVVASLMLPVVYNFWKLLPEEAYFDAYGSLQVFGWTFGVHFMLIMISIAWWFSINSKDYVLQLFSLATLFYSVFITYATLPFTTHTSWWLNVTATAGIFTCIVAAALFIKKR